MASICIKSYFPLPSFEDEAPDLPPPRPWLLLLRKFSLPLFIVTSMLSMLALGYILGSWHGQLSRDTYIEPSGDLHYYMQYNGSYPQRSSARSDALWDSLFPEKKGFVQHPELAPNVAGIAVFHELHCLDILRTAFFASVDGLLEQMGAETEEMNHRTSHHHIRHCFEYLRQSLICLADSNLEEMNYTIQGVSGWQTERKCRNFEQLKSWADDWGISREDALHNWNTKGSHLSNDSNETM